MNLLSIDQGGKGVPYGGHGIAQPDGGANYGFKNLRTNPRDIDSVPELAANLALKRLVETMNAPGRGLFTIGCESGPVPDQGKGYRHTGYVEFALNSRSAVADASSYFPVFFHFDRFLHVNTCTDGVKFDWELMGANFSDVGIGGFTCTIYINTPLVAAADDARAMWDSALEALAEYFEACGREAVDPIYKLPTTPAL